MSVPDKRHCVISKEGKEVKHNVNRLIKQHRWDEWHADTMTAFAARTEERNTPGKLEKEKEGERREKEIKTGETIIFPMNMSDSHPIPFGSWESSRD